MLQFTTPPLKESWLFFDCSLLDSTPICTADVKWMSLSMNVARLCVKLGRTDDMVKNGRTNILLFLCGSRKGKTSFCQMLILSCCEISIKYILKSNTMKCHPIATLLDLHCSETADPPFLNSHYITRVVLFTGSSH